MQPNPTDPLAHVEPPSAQPQQTPETPYRWMKADEPPPPPVPRAPVRSVEFVALLSWMALCELLLWPSGLGVGVAALLAIAPGLFWLASDTRVRSARQVAIVSLLAVMSLRLAWQPSWPALLLAFALLFAFALSLKDRHAYVPEALGSLPVSLVWALPLSGHFAGALRQRVTPEGLRTRRWREVTIPLAVIAGFALVFTAANPLVARWATKVFDKVFSLRGLPTVGHVFFWVVTALGSIVLLRPYLLREPVGSVNDPAHDLAPSEKLASATHAATARNLLIGLNALFFAHNALDAVYLWAGKLPPGVGHTEYAHQGAFWLTVALAMSTAVLGWVFHRMTSADPASKPLRVLAYVWAAQNLVMSAGTFERVWKYVDFSGLTSLRIVGVTGSALVAVSFAMIVRKVHADRSLVWLLRRDLDALVVAVVLFTALPIDGWVSRFNTSRIRRHEYRPLLHLIQQDTTAESVAGLLPLLSHPDPVVRDGVAAKLLELRDTLLREQRQAPHWTAWSMSRARALKLLSSRHANLSGGRDQLDAPEHDDRWRSSSQEAFRRRAWTSNDQPPQGL